MVSALKETGDFLKAQLSGLFGDMVEISTCSLSDVEETPLRVDCDLAVFCSQNALMLSDTKLELSCPGLLANRSVNYDQLDEVLGLPDGTEAFIFNDFRESTIMTMEYLQDLGINHIKYVPVWPGKLTDGKARPLITVDEFDNLPDTATEIINIGIRPIDISTIVEIMLRLELPQDVISKYTVKYVSDIISLAKEINSLNKHNISIRSRLEEVVQSINDGIITIGKGGTIQLINSACAEAFGLEAETLLGKSVNELPAALKDALSSASENVGDQDIVFSFDGKSMAMTALKTDEDGQIFVVNEIKRIQTIEQNLRVKMAKNRYVARYTFDDIKGSSPGMLRQKTLARNLANFRLPVYIFGESGTGKELFAQAIHNASDRRSGPFVAVNFAAMSESLLESELFGYAEGAFTGAKKGGMPGVFEQAHGGTIFLDEIGDSPLSFQTKLLRVLQEKQVRRIGDDKLIPVDVRVIVATNKDIYKLVEEGKFREDLYYRLNVLPLRLSPLRELREDIPVIAGEFYDEVTSEMKGMPPFETFFEGKLNQLKSYNYRGNFRQLRNVIDYLACTSEDGRCPDIDMAFGEEIARPGAAERSDPGADGPGSGTSEQLEGLIGDLRPLIYRKPADRVSVLEEIGQRQVRGLSSGRRSLAEALGISEEKVKELCAALAAEGLISVNKGRKGITLTPKGYLELERVIKV